MRKLLLILLFFRVIDLTAQSKVGFVDEEMALDSVYAPSLHEHTSLRPLVRSSIRYSLLRSDSCARRFAAQGIIDAAFFIGNSQNYRLGGGFLAEFAPNQKWYARLSGIEGITNGTGNLVPQSYLTDSRDKYTMYTDVRGRLSYSPNEIFNFQAGLDKNFIGEGSRSLLLSDYGKAYPFGLIRTKFWRVEYNMIYQFYREKTDKGSMNKYGATHYLSFNATKWLNFGLFETVVFMPKDTMLNRGYDAEYLNPAVFFRPQEYAMGSSDNVLIGASFSARYKSHTFYGQFILDEFFLAEVKAKSGWWANKYGGQIGVKGRRVRHGLPWFYRIEYNALRPYTYAHLNSGQNYGNAGSVLAHPLDANVMEILGELKTQKGKWNAKLFVSYFLKGLDKNGFSYGGDIYQPYNNRPYEYGHFVGQGRANNGTRAILQVGYLVHKETNLNVFMEHQLRYDTSFDKYTYWGALGIRSQLWNDYRNY
jgi:hypothetical protein